MSNPSDTAVALRRTPLFDQHREAGARIVEFAGWEMPVQYQGVIEEHRAVRTAAGLFDVSHMGEVRVTGPGAQRFVDSITPNDVAKLAPGRAHYSGLLNERGGYLDDILVYRIAQDDILIVVNASNAPRDAAWIEGHARDFADVEVEDQSDRWALLALQGPKAVGILSRLTDAALAEIKYYRFAQGTVDGVPAILSRTGYTGEDGFELYLAPEEAPRIWKRLLEVGGPDGLVPAGLGARDTLRLEAGMALYGHELDETTTPWEAGLDWVVKMDKGDFLGREALRVQKENGVPRRLVGFEVTGRGIARNGHRLRDASGDLGPVTSGTWSPTFEKAIGMGYLPAAKAAVGSELEAEVRGKGIPARLVALPFYKRAK